MDMWRVVRWYRDQCYRETVRGNPPPPIPPALPASLAPNRRARQLYFQALTPSQSREWAESGYITIVGSDGNRYLQCYGNDHNVYCDNVVFCSRPPGLPTWDRMLAQKLLIETNVNAFRSVAVHNAWPLEEFLFRARRAAVSLSY